MVSDVADVSLRCFGEAQKIGGTGTHELGYLSIRWINWMRSGKYVS